MKNYTAFSKERMKQFLAKIRFVCSGHLADFNQLRNKRDFEKYTKKIV